MNSMNDLSFLNKQVQCKIRGIQQYKKRLAVSGESLYHPFKRNVKPKVCLKSSHQANVPDSTRVFESRQPAKASHQRSLVNSENSFSRDIPQGDLAHTAFIIDSPEKYLSLLKAHNSVSISGDCGRVMVLKDYNASLDKLNIKIPSRKSLRRQTSDVRRSLFSGKRLADYNLVNESPAKKLKYFQDIIEAVERLESRDLIADGSRGYTLPTIPGKHGDLKSICPDTVANVVEGRYAEQQGKVTIVDCRYPNDFEIGHIRGAVNLYTMEAVSAFLDGSSMPGQPYVLFYHCEFGNCYMRRIGSRYHQEMSKCKINYVRAC